MCMLTLLSGARPFGNLFLIASGAVSGSAAILLLLLVPWAALRVGGVAAAEAARRAAHGHHHGGRRHRPRRGPRLDRARQARRPRRPRRQPARRPAEHQHRRAGGAERPPVQRRHLSTRSTRANARCRRCGGGTRSRTASPAWDGEGRRAVGGGGAGSGSARSAEVPADGR